MDLAKDVNLEVKGEIDPEKLSPDSKKQLCWNLYVLEGKNTREIASITGLSQRSVERHIKEWKETLENNPEVVQELAGELQAKIQALFSEFFKHFKEAPPNLKPQWAGILSGILKMQWEKAVPDNIRQAMVVVKVEGKTDEGRKVVSQCDKCHTYHEPNKPCRLIDEN